MLVGRVEQAPATRTVRLHGVTRGVEEATLSLTLAGRLVERRVDVGDRVAAGDVIARLDPEGWQLQVAQAAALVDDLEARAAQTAADLVRLRALRASDSVSVAEVERLETEDRAVRANLDRARVGHGEAQRQAREAVLRAPRAGVIAAIFAEPRETVAAGTPVARLVGEGVEIELEAPESVWSGVLVGDPARVLLPGLGCTLEGRVTRVGSAAAGPGRLFPVHVGIASTPGCTPAAGLAARVDLEVAVPPSWSVPLRAVVDPTGSGASVFAVHQGTVRRVEVRPMHLLGERVAVQAELLAGDEVVTGGLVGLTDGLPVEVRR